MVTGHDGDDFRVEFVEVLIGDGSDGLCIEATCVRVDFARNIVLRNVFASLILPVTFTLDLGHVSAGGEFGPGGNAGRLTVGVFTCQTSGSIVTIFTGVLRYSSGASAFTCRAVIIIS